MPPEDCEDPAESDAVRLFAERARQVRPDFTIAADPAGVIRLCRITEGLPLALELAAAWTRTLSCEEIADEIERNIAFLSTDLRNVPERQRSIQAAFDYSWALLNEDERRTFQRLAVFRGGFRREAAQQVAGATLPLLSSLVDKSLIRVGADGRFYLHELLRQYADEHLRAIPGEAERIAKAHREFYLAFVANRFAPIPGGITPEAIEEINAELGNIRAAWRGAVAAADSAGLGQAAHPLALFYDFRTRYREGLTMLEDGLRALRAADPSPEVERVIALLLVNSARFHHKLGDLPAMLAAIDEGEARYQQIGDPPPPGLMTDPGLWRALLTLVDGDYAEAARIGDEVIERNTAQDRLGNLPFTWWLRAAAALWQEDPAAGEYARRSTEAALAIDDRWNLTYSYNMQGHVATATGDYTGAWRYYEAGYALREEFNDPEGMGTNLGHMARVALLQGDLTQAEQLYRRSLSIAREIGDLVSIANALNGLGLTACATGDYASAGQHFAEGLQWTAETRFMRLLLILLASAGDWLLQTGQPAEAVGPLAIAQAHPAGDRETRARAAKLLATVAGALPPDIYAAAIDRHQGRDPAEQAAHLIPILTRQPATDEPATPDQSAPSALVEPLTARELDVLRLIAAGRSNREIADELFLAVNTVRSYSQQLYGKLAVSSRTQAVARARELGLIS
jgi:ATP/maltotriose-dependent transcriptional regulator MalT